MVPYSIVEWWNKEKVGYGFINMKELPGDH